MTGLKTDRYELAMVASLIREGRADTPAVFEAFTRSLPAGRRYGVVVGLGRFVNALQDFRFTENDIEWLIEEGVIDAPTAAWLSEFRFRGNVSAYREGEVYFPYSPVVEVSGTLAECLLVETLLLSILNHDSAVASAASRMVDQAGGRPLIDMGSRRTHEDAAVAAARAAFIAGFVGTSNLQAGKQYGIPTMGTAAHAFILAHLTEREAFVAQIAQHGLGTTILVDTFDIEEGIRAAIDIAGAGLGAIRLDSGDLAMEAKRARALLDTLGAQSTQIVVTSDLDEYSIAELHDAPVDSFGVGTRLVTGSGHPTAGMVYKLVAIDNGKGELRPVEKRSRGKGNVGGVKSPYRLYDAQGRIIQERLGGEQLDERATHTISPLRIPVVRNGEVVHSPRLAEVRAHAASSLSTLPIGAHDITPGEPAIDVK